MKVLITGFMPFGGETINPAYEAVKDLPKQIAGAQVVTAELPVVYGGGARALEAAIEETAPDIVICVGQAGGRAAIALERIGINLRESQMPDNDGNTPDGDPVRADGPAAYFATIPVKAMVQSIREAGIPATISYTAGSYVCNDLLYSLQDMIHCRHPHIRGGFIHVPFDTKQVIAKPATTPSMPIATITAALEAAIKAAVLHREDIVIPCGETH